MSVLSTIGALQTLHAAITGVGSAPQAGSYPANASRSTMEAGSLSFPLVLTFPAESEVRGAASSRRIFLNTFDVLVLLGRINETSLVNDLTTLATLMRAFDETYTDPAKLLLGEGVSVLGAEGDLLSSGWSEINYAGTVTRGFVYRVRIKEQG